MKSISKHWIDVKESLPEFDKTVLGYVPPDGYVPVKLKQVTVNKDGNVPEFYTAHTEPLLVKEVSHWLPFSPPIKK